MIHGYMSLSGLISFLIVQNFANKNHPTEESVRSQESGVGQKLVRGLLGVSVALINLSDRPVLSSFNRFT